MLSSSPRRLAVRTTTDKTGSASGFGGGLIAHFLINNLKRLKYELILIITIYIIIQMSTTTVQPFDGKAAAADAPKQNVDMKDVRIDIS